MTLCFCRAFLCGIIKLKFGELMDLYILGGKEMQCIYCGDELLEGKIQLYELGSVILKMPATLKFIPKEKTEKVKKANQFDDSSHGFYCKKCNRIFADFIAEKSVFDN